MNRSRARRRAVQAALIAVSVAAAACAPGPTPSPAPTPPGGVPIVGSDSWRRMEAALVKACERDEGGPHRAETCRRLRADFARGKVVFREAVSVRANWAYGWLAFADLGGGAWGGAVFHLYEGQWLVAGFDGHDPEVRRPACNGPEWREMASALAAACTTGDPERHRELCRRLSGDFAGCKVDFRDAFDVRPSWGVGFAALSPLESATWGAAVFRRVGGRWVVAGFDAGEIH